MDQRSEAETDPRPDRLRLALAARAEADGLRARRAERLARIRAGAFGEPGEAGAETGAETDQGMPAAPAAERRDNDEPAPPSRDAEALERFLADLVGTIDTEPAPPQPARVAPTRLAPVLPLPRPSAAAGDGADLSRLPGAGPGLVGALIRGGVPDLAALAGLGRDALAGKLGPLGRLIDLDGWLAFARDASGRPVSGREDRAPSDWPGRPRDLAG